MALNKGNNKITELRKEGNRVLVMCSMKKASRKKSTTIVRQCAIHVVGMI